MSIFRSWKSWTFTFLINCHHGFITTFAFFPKHCIAFSYVLFALPLFALIWGESEFVFRFKVHISKFTVPHQVITPSSLFGGSPPGPTNIFFPIFKSFEASAGSGRGRVRQRQRGTVPQRTSVKYLIVSSCHLRSTSTSLSSPSS